MGVSESTLSIKPGQVAGETKRDHFLDYLEQKNEVIKLKPQSKGKNHNLPAFTDVGLIAAIGVTFLRENPLDAFFLEIFKFARHGFGVWSPDWRAVFELAADKGEI